MTDGRAPLADDDGELRLSHRLAAAHVAGILVLVLVVVASVLWIGRQYDRLALQSSQELVENRLSGFRTRLHNAVRDFSTWDAAYDAIVAGDREWLGRNIGSAVSEFGSLDLVAFIASPGEAAFGWRRVGASAPAGGAVLPRALADDLLGLLAASDAEVPETRTLLAEFEGAPWGFSVARMTPIADLPVGTAAAELPVQVIGRQLTEARLHQLGRGTPATDLAFAAAPARGQAALPLAGVDGTAFAHIVWEAPRPSAGVLRRVALPLTLALLLAAGVGMVCSRYAVRSARRLERALKAARIADRSKTEFLSNVSHELRTPMNGILGVAQLLETTGLDAEQRELVGVLFASANAQMALISDLLDLGRLDCGNRQLVEAPFEPAGVLKDLAEMMRVAAAEKAIALEADWSALEALEVRGDARAFRQIVTNLLGNAVKFTDRGRVVLRASVVGAEDRAEVAVEVADTGRGIPAEALPHVFERFYQAGDSARRAEGTGLGLAISQALARMMGGRIEAESQPGAGSTFTLRVGFDLAVPRTEARDAA